MAGEDTTTRTLILGGGLAGIAAAVRLAQLGQSVTLLETRKRLGGRATSFTDAATGRELDNCQHVVMKCCTNLLDLYDRLGVAQNIQWHRRFFFVDAQGRLDEMVASDLPAPFHLTASLLGFTTLSWSEKIAIARGMRGVMTSAMQQWEKQSFAQWLDAHQQPESVIEKFWRPVVVGAINETIEGMSAAAALQVFQQGFLSHEEACWMGLPDVPLARLYDRAVDVITAAGGQVRMNSGAAKLSFDGQKITGVTLDSGEFLAGDAIISALPFDRLAKIAPPELVAADDRLKHLRAFEVSPIIGIHLWVRSDDGPEPFALPHLSFMQSPLHWIFNKGFDHAAQAQHLHGVISAAHDLLTHTSRELAQMAMDELRKVIPAMRQASLVEHLVVKEKSATFSARPGLQTIRPGARGQVESFYLAGDWCASGWPATMEGAVRSGYLAAAAAMQDQGIIAQDATLLAKDLPVSPFYRLLGGQSSA